MLELKEEIMPKFIIDNILNGTKENSEEAVYMRVLN